ncbi:MAG TPA: MarR family transcriptional regulator [Mucilaginibacter sp.]|jgi:DNA-binding MarR family transcriptional regulator|nr:MarR family transcriptional regulator [Mucilaginibacter sp.]
MTTQIENRTKTDLAVGFGRSMSELRTYTRQQIQLKIKEHAINITFEMLEVMGCLWRKDGINQQEIADLTLRDKSSMTYLLDNLVKRKLVRRVEDENDRRNKLIYLTSEGNELREQLNPWVAEVYEMASEGVDIDNLQNGIMLVNKMIKNLRNQ